MFQRKVKPSKNNSFFLFGARGTGKSTFVRDQFLENSQVLTIDLLDPNIEELYAKSPMALYEKIKPIASKLDWVFIDEVQKIPRLLDVVHKSIEELKVKFILTGSSARKLKRGGANLLAGRAFLYSLFPLTRNELGDSFNLDSVLRWGSLPKIFSYTDDNDKKQYLRGYSQVYIKEEIKIEQLVRNIDPFRGFLEVSAQMNGKIINYTKIANDVGVDHKTVQNYYEILADTWIGYFLPSFHQSVRKSQKLSPKFYFFDLGVKNSLSHLLDSKPTPGNSLYGDLFEHFIINEVFRLNEYHQKDYRMSYLATKNNLEIDLILSKGRSHIAVEIKSDSQINYTEINKLKNLALDIKNIKQIFLVSNHKENRIIDGVECLYWEDFLLKFSEF